MTPALIATVAALAATTTGLAVWVRHLRRALHTHTTDPLTGLPTRRAFYRRAARLLGHPHTTVALLDMNGFKALNDRHGHAAGDRALAVTAARLQDHFGPRALISRLGGDEFAVVFHAATPAAAQRQIILMQAELAPDVHLPHALGGGTVQLRAAVGAVHLGRVPNPTISDALHHADGLMYRAKHAATGPRYVLEHPTQLTHATPKPVARQRAHGPCTTLRATRAAAVTNQHATTTQQTPTATTSR